MRLSVVVELLLILLLIAFAAYGRVIDSTLTATNRSIRASNVPKQSVELPTISQTTENVNRYCTCSDVICNCCRDFHIPLVQLQGPGCASLQYLQGDNLAVQLSFGNNILTSTIVNGKSPKPVCVPLPGGFTKFCGRIYSIKRDSNDHFKACLGLELQSATELEASLRVSCFRFGPDGLKLRPAEPLPVVETEQTSEEDDDDDLFGLGPDDDDDDDDDASSEAETYSGATNEATEEDEDDDEDDDVLGFGALLDIITGDDETSTKKPKVTTAPPLLQFTIPILTRPTTAATPLDGLETATVENDATILHNSSPQDTIEQENNEIQGPNKVEEETHTEAAELLTETDSKDETTPESLLETQQDDTPKPLDNQVKPEKQVVSHKVKRVPAVQNKKPTITSSSINAINDDIKKKKPAKKPVKDDDDDDILDDDDDDDDDDDEEALDDDKDEDLDDDLDEDDDEEDDEDDNDEDADKHEEDDEDEKTEDLDELDDDDDEEEEAVLSALVDDDKPKTKKNKAVVTPPSHADEDEDYGIGITDFLARKRRARGGRQSKVMRL